MFEKINVEGAILDIKEELKQMNKDNDQFKSKVEYQLERLNTNLEKVITLVEKCNVR